MRYFINVVPRAHVQEGFTGEESRLRRPSRGDAIVFYSPRSDKKFTAIGEVVDDAPYHAGDGDPKPWRRNVKFLDCAEAAVQPLIDELEFIRNKTTWGVAFRRGYFEIGEADYRRIADAMRNGGPG